MKVNTTKAPIPRTYEDGGRQRTRWLTGWNQRKPSVIVLHYTATLTAKMAHTVMVRRGVSAHATLERDGTALRHVNDDNRTYHAGQSSWNGISGMNNHALGLEIVNIGWLDGEWTSDLARYAQARKMKVYRAPRTDPERCPDTDGRSFYRKEGTIYVVTTQPAKVFPDHRLSEQGQLWAQYTKAQKDAVVEIVARWMEKFDILPENVIGHEHVSPGRKTDPGPGFRYVWLGLMDDLFARVQHTKPELFNPRHRTPERVMALQSHLSRLGVYHASIDGIWGRGTEAGVLAAKRWSSVYNFDYCSTITNVTGICECLRLIPGFNPDTL